MPRISGATWYTGSQPYAYLFIDYSFSQNPSGNQSTFSYAFGIHFENYYFNSTNRTVNANASPGSASHSYYDGPQLPWPYGGTHQDYVYHTDSFIVNHDAAGNATVNISGQINPTSSGGGGTRVVSGSVVLPQIPRFSTPPSAPVISAITSSSVFVTFTDGSGGAAIDSRQIGYGTDPSGPSTIIASDGSTSITGLTQSTTYYFWARTHNVAGYTDWSPRTPATTLGVPPAPSQPVLSGATQTSVVVSWTSNGDGGSPITGYQVGYSTTTTPPGSGTAAASSPATITGLSPGTTYYFWVRAQNAVGFSPWSALASNTSIAGVRIKVGPVWKLAIPYVKVAGVWRLARPYVKVFGVWKETV